MPKNECTSSSCEGVFCEMLLCGVCGELGKKEDGVVKCGECGSSAHEGCFVSACGYSVIHVKMYNFDTGWCEVKMTKRSLGCTSMLPCKTEYEFAEANCTCGPNQETMANCPKHSDAWYAWLAGEYDESSQSD